MYQAPSFFVETLFIPNIQPIKIFHLVITLCKRGGGTLGMVTMSNDILIPSNPQHILEVNWIKVSKVIKAWHGTTTKFQNLPMCQSIRQWLFPMWLWYIMMRGFSIEGGIGTMVLPYRILECNYTNQNYNKSNQCFVFHVLK